ncbi:MAG: GNAT family N-acetyltransferase [Cocleimonas sp.]|nr:GNAT family N-acetyltransferase [Cocleimonas sp.]
MKNLREMQESDIDKIVAIIDSHDEDDAEEAEAGYRQMGGTYDNYVYEVNGEAIGVTGFAIPPACEHTYWLSWTYIDDEQTNKGHGRKMLNELIAHIKDVGGRKLFVKVSDYVDPEDGAIYAAALHLYKSLGFEVELSHKHFYDQGETQIILGLRLKDKEDLIIEEDECNIQFDGVFEIAETDDAYSFSWHDEGEYPLEAEDVKVGINAVRNDGARAIFLSFPSNMINIKDPLLQSGFSNAGKLKDYYDDGIDENHYSLYR